MKFWKTLKGGSNNASSSSGSVRSDESKRKKGKDVVDNATFHRNNQGKQQVWSSLHNCYVLDLVSVAMILTKLLFSFSYCVCDIDKPEVR